MATFFFKKMETAYKKIETVRAPSLHWHCRDDKIRTCGLFVPNEARYRAALHPEPLCAAKLLLFLKMQAKNLLILHSEF